MEVPYEKGDWVRIMMDPKWLNLFIDCPVKSMEGRTEKVSDVFGEFSDVVELHRKNVQRGVMMCFGHRVTWWDCICKKGDFCAQHEKVGRCVL